MKQKLIRTKVTVRLRKSEYRMSFPYYIHGFPTPGPRRRGGAEPSYSTVQRQIWLGSPRLWFRKTDNAARVRKRWASTELSPRRGRRQGFRVQLDSQWVTINRTREWGAGDEIDFTRLVNAWLTYCRTTPEP